MWQLVGMAQYAACWIMNAVVWGPNHASFSFFPSSEFKVVGLEPATGSVNIMVFSSLATWCTSGVW